MVINPLSIKRVILAHWQVDFRKGHLGLLGECRMAGFEPWAGDCVVFISKCRTRVKLLCADQTGLWLAYKQFAKGTLATLVPVLQRPEAQDLSFSDLSMLLDGNRYVVTHRKPPWRPAHLAQLDN
jgi:hypothetical protein